MLDTLEKRKVNVKDLSLSTPEKPGGFQFDFEAAMSERDWVGLDAFFNSFVIEGKTEQPPSKRAEFAGHLRWITDRYKETDTSQLLLSSNIYRSPNDYSPSQALNTYPERALALVALEGRDPNIIDEEAWRELKGIANHALEDTRSNFYAAHLAQTAKILIVGKMLYPGFDQDKDWVEKRRKDLLNWLNTSNYLHQDDIAVMGAGFKFTSPKGAAVPDIVNSKSDFLTEYFNTTKNLAITDSRFHWLTLASYSFYLKALNAAEIQINDKGINFIDKPRLKTLDNPTATLPKVRSF